MEKKQVKVRRFREISFGPTYNKPSDYAGRIMKSYNGDEVTIVKDQGSITLKIGNNTYPLIPDQTAAYWLNRNRVGVLEE